MKKTNGGMLRNKLLLFMLSFAILFISLSLFVSSEQNTYRRQDYLTLISNTPHCIDNCETVYRICPNGASDTTFDLDFKEKSGQKQKGLTSQKSFKNEIKGSGFHLKSLIIDYKKPVAVEVGVYGDCQQNITRINNETRQEETISVVTRCIIGTATEWREGTAWENFTPGKIKEIQSCFPLRVRGTINWGDYVDNIVSFAGYTYDEYAEWTGDVLQHTLTADFAGNGTNITNTNDKLAVNSGSGEGSQPLGPIIVNDNFESYSTTLSLSQNWTNNGGTNATPQLREYRCYGGIKCAVHNESTSYDIKKIQSLSTAGSNVTLDLRVNFTESVPGDTSKNICLGASGISPNGCIGGMYLRYGSSCGGQTSFCNQLSGSQNQLGNISTPEQWHRIVVILSTIGGDVRIDAYLDGAQVGTSDMDTYGALTAVTTIDTIWMSSGDLPEVFDNYRICDGAFPQGCYGSSQSVQGNYYSQKIDTGTENESIRINVSTNNASAVKFEARVSNTSAGLDVLDWTVFTHNTDLITKSRWLQYRFNFTHDLSEVTEVNVSRRFDALGNEQGDEANARAAIDSTVSSHLSSYTLYTAQQVYLRNASGTQALATVDKVVVKDNKRWLLNYLAGSDSVTGIFNITPVVYSYEMTNLTTSQIQQRVGQFINSTK